MGLQPQRCPITWATFWIVSPLTRPTVQANSVRQFDSMCRTSVRVDGQILAGKGRGAYDSSRLPRLRDRLGLDSEVHVLIGQ